MRLTLIPTAGRARGRLGAAACAAALLAANGAAPAQANVQKPFTLSCTYPFVGSQPTAIDLDAAIPDRAVAGQAFPAFPVSATANGRGGTAGFAEIVGATTIEGGLAISVGAGQVAIDVPLSIPSQPTVQQPDGSLMLNAVGSTPAFTLKATSGLVSFIINSMAFNLTVRGEDGAAIPTGSDGLAAFDVPCRFDPVTQDRVLATVEIGPYIPIDPPPPTPKLPVATEVTSTSAKVCWAQEGTTLPNGVFWLVTGPTNLTTGEPCFTFTDLAPGGTYSVSVQGKSFLGTSGPGPVLTFMTQPTPTPTPTPNCLAATDSTVVDYAYALAGAATLKTLTKGSLPLTGSITARLGLPSGCFTGDLSLNKTSGNLLALGFLPVTAQVSIVPTEQVKGTLRGGVLKAEAKFRIKLPKVSLFGIELAGGANCRAKSISSSALQSTQAQFQPLSGGPIAGTFSISDLSGCGALTGIVSPLTAGKGNAILLNLTPSTAPAAP